MEKSDPPVPYTVEYSGLILRQLRQLAAEASARGDGPVFAAALREFDRLLRLYPQFGDPQIDLTAESGIIYSAIIPPISMRYAIYEQRRLVLIVAQPVLLPQARTDAHEGE